MPKYPKPWSRRKASGNTYWYVTLSGRQIALGDNKEAAFAKYHRLMAEHGKAAPPGPEGVTFPELVVYYLRHLETDKGGVNFETRRIELQRLNISKTFGSLQAAEVRKLHLSQLERALRDDKYSATSIHHSMRAVKAVFTWGVENDYLQHNAVTGYRVPAAHGRTRVITADEFQRLLRAAAWNAPLRRVLFALRETGCRPCEVRRLTWDMVDSTNGVWVIPIIQHKTGTQQREPRPRIVPVTELVSRMLATFDNSNSHVFLNEDGNPWQQRSLSTAFRRVRERAGIPADVKLYCTRHTFASTNLGKVSDIELAELMGHTSTRTLRKYTHTDVERIKAIRKRIG